MFLMIHTISWGSRWLIWEPFAKWHLKVPSAPVDATSTNKKIENFSQCINAATFHVLSAFFAWRIMWGENRLWPPDNWDEDGITKLNDLDFKFYYLLYAARYISDLFSLFFEHARSVSQSCC